MKLASPVLRIRDCRITIRIRWIEFDSVEAERAMGSANFVALYLRYMEMQPDKCGKLSKNTLTNSWLLKELIVREII